jgi:hypothetical protein
MAQRLLEGEYENIIDMKGGANDDELRQLRQENRKLDEALRGVRNELGQAIADKENLERSIRALRNQLSPLHRYLRALFGEIELAVGEEEFSQPTASTERPAASPSAGNSDFWEKWKQKLGGKQADILDALMGHPGMTSTAVSKAAACRNTTASTLLSRLNGMGLVEKNGGLWRLKSI